jgi:hypothetical protein
MVASHPFARKKAKGWGTEMVQNQTVKDLVAPFGGLFNAVDSGSFSASCKLVPFRDGFRLTRYGTFWAGASFRAGLPIFCTRGLG